MDFISVSAWFSSDGFVAESDAVAVVDLLREAVEFLAVVLFATLTALIAGLSRLLLVHRLELVLTIRACSRASLSTMALICCIKRRKHRSEIVPPLIASVFSDRLLRRWVSDRAFDDVEDVGYAATVLSGQLPVRLCLVVIPVLQLTLRGSFLAASRSAFFCAFRSSSCCCASAFAALMLCAVGSASTLLLADL